MSSIRFIENPLMRSFVLAVKSLSVSKVRGSWRLYKFISNFIYNWYVPIKFQSDYCTFVQLQDYIGQIVWESQDYEPEISATIQKFIQDGYAYYDIGANIGLHVLSVAQSRPTIDLPIVAVEPDPINALVLRKNILLNGIENVHVHEVGCSNVTGEMHLHLTQSHNRGTFRIVPPDEETGTKVHVMTLDQILAEHDLTTPLLVKIDVEGHETQVLEGGLSDLQKLPELAVVQEFNPSFFMVNGDLFERWLQVMTTLNFDSHALIISGENLEEIQLVDFRDLQGLEKRFSPGVVNVLSKK